MTSARPSARARAFCSSMAWRTAGIPPRRSCSATGSSSGCKAARAALRWTVEAAGCGRPVGPPRPGLRSGRSLRPGRPLPPCGERAAGWRRRPSPLRASPVRLSPVRPPPVRPSPVRPSGPPRGLVPRRSPRPLDARTTFTSGPERGVPSTSMRSVGRLSSFARLGASARTVVPSRVVSTSARRTVPGVVPSGTSAATTVPRGWRAPAARHVHASGETWAVSSMSMRWAIPADTLVRSEGALGTRRRPTLERRSRQRSGASGPSDPVGRSGGRLPAVARLWSRRPRWAP